MQTILHEITKDVTRQVFIRQGDGTNIRGVLKEAKSKSWTNIIVDMNISNTAILLRTVGCLPGPDEKYRKPLIKHTRLKQHSP